MSLESISSQDVNASTENGTGFRDKITRQAVTVLVDFAAGIVSNVNTQRRENLGGNPSGEGEPGASSDPILSASDPQFFTDAFGFVSDETAWTRHPVREQNDSKNSSRPGAHRFGRSVGRQLHAIRRVNMGIAVKAGLVEVGVGLKTQAPSREKVSEFALRKLANRSR
jgi:hypothetical protein